MWVLSSYYQQTRVCKARDRASNAHWGVGSLVCVRACIFKQAQLDLLLDEKGHALDDQAQQCGDTGL